ncbi:hypothetical protein MMPV_003364 [Pyropia vietnamensis]
MTTGAGAAGGVGGAGGTAAPAPGGSATPAAAGAAMSSAGLPPTAPPGSSRLDGLLDLLAEGTSTGVRRMAARQLGDLAAAHAPQVPALLRRVRRLLRASSWDTRVAAGHTIAAIAGHTPAFGGGGVGAQTAKVEGDARTAAATAAALAAAAIAFPQGLLTLESLSIPRLLTGGALLLGSSGAEYAGGGGDVATQRARLQEHLGLDGRLGGASEVLDIKDEDLASRRGAGVGASPGAGAGTASVESTASVGDMVAEMGGGEAGLSARERNRLKREAKKRTKLGHCPAGRPPKRPRSTTSGGGDGGDGDVGAVGAGADRGSDGGVDSGAGGDSDEEAGEAEDARWAGGWPFGATLEVLKYALLEPRWEARHGAAVGLREILKAHAGSAGRFVPAPALTKAAAVEAAAAPSRTDGGSTADAAASAATVTPAVPAVDMSPAAAQARNFVVLEDVACRLLCVLALDRFGDYVGDAVVAPVRETAAQALACTAAVLPPDRVSALLRSVLALATAAATGRWEVRHAALLGVRYLLAVRADLAAALLADAYPVIVAGLRDDDDDVRAVAAEALAPVVGPLTAALPSSVPRLVRLLWATLLDLDDISASTASVLRLLAALSGTAPPLGFAPLWLEAPRASAGGAAVVKAEPGTEAGDSLDLGSDLDDDEDGEDGEYTLGGLIPRLWPFLRHTSVDVRRAALQTLESLVSASLASPDTSALAAGVAAQALSRIYVCLLLDNDETALAAARRVWQSLLLRAPPPSTSTSAPGAPGSTLRFAPPPPFWSVGIAGGLAPRLPLWFRLASCQSRGEGAAVARAGDGAATLTVVSARAAAARARRAAKAEKAAARRGSSAAVGSGLGTSLVAHDAVIIEGPEEGLLMQLSAAEALGLLAKLWPRAAGVPPQAAGEGVPRADPAVADAMDRALLAELTSPFGSARRVACLVVQVWASSRTTLGVGTDGGAFPAAVAIGTSSASVERLPSAVRASVEREVVATGGATGDCLFAEVGAASPSFFADAMALLDAILAIVPLAEVAATGVDVAAARRAFRQGLDFQAAMAAKKGRGAAAASATPAAPASAETAAAAAALAAAARPHASLVATGAYALYEARAAATAAAMPRPEAVVALRKGGRGGARKTSSATSAAADAERRRDLLDATRLRVLAAIGYATIKTGGLATALRAAAAAAVAADDADPLPARVGPLIKALVGAVRATRDVPLQRHAGAAVAVLVRRLVAAGMERPAAMLVKNLAKYRTSRDVLPAVAPLGGDAAAGVAASISTGADEPVDVQWRGAGMALRALCVAFGRDLFVSLPSLWALLAGALRPADDAAAAAPVLSAADAMTVLRTVVRSVHADLHPSLASLLPSIVTHTAVAAESGSAAAGSCLAEMVAAMPALGMRVVVQQLLPLLSSTGSTAASAQGVEEGGKGGVEAARLAVGALLTSAGDAEANGGGDATAGAAARRGAAAALRCVVDTMDLALVPYAAFLVVPVMARMVDHDDGVRAAAAGIFGVLVRLMPLEGGGDSSSGDEALGADLAAQREEARSFLGQLLGTAPRSHYALPVAIHGDVTLRRYQQECLDWLAFLHRYGLHGALCDDMGLGKTLMTLCMIAGDHHTQRADIREGRSIGPPRASLVVCPSTLVAHWGQEAARFFPHVFDKVLLYAGPPKERARLRRAAASAAGGDGGSPLAAASLVITSYDVLANDLSHFTCLSWSYVALDEGHVIKNPRTKAAAAVRSVAASHRLVLTGTPIQNTVLELWSIFDFLMPGFLGTERSFRDAYAKPILASRELKVGERERERGLLAMEALHRQVLPFVLRRMKEDVLSELPPKIIQDYSCELTPLQVRLYEDFSKNVLATGLPPSTTAVAGGSGAVGGTEGKGQAAAAKRSPFALQALQYLRRLCSHPRLVLSDKHPELPAVRKELAATGQSLNDVAMSAKLIALQSILTDCGIGVSGGGGGHAGSSAAVAIEGVDGAVRGGHRALVFAQLKPMLDIVESDLFRAAMPGVSYLRLDGSVEASKRQSIATRFNADPSIDVLLLTTHVGGLGLNLTGADVVIFLEHDYNPAKDLQAMDRAHRLGQKRVVNVYRLITRGTLEEKIMNVQRFKTHVANTVVNRENSSLQSMNTSELLDLFKIENGGAAASAAGGDSPSGSAAGADNGGGAAAGLGGGLKAALEGIGDLWDDAQYADEYNMDGFLDAAAAQ